MLQIELRVNGCLIDYVTITQQGLAGNMPGCYSYAIERATGEEKTFVAHDYGDGALKLASLALAALAEKGATCKKPSA